jgi:hypothetical protein
VADDAFRAEAARMCAERGREFTLAAYMEREKEVIGEMCAQ